MISEGEVLNELNALISDKIAGTFTGEVISNSDAESKAVIEVVKGKKQDGEEQITYDARLKSIIDEKDKHFICVPKKGSEVFCVPVSNSKERYMAISYNEIEKVVYKGEKVSLVIDDNEGTVVLNDGSNGGLIKINDLVEKINRLENDFLAHIHTGGSGPTGTPQDETQAPIVWAPTVSQDIENDKIKH